MDPFITAPFAIRLTLPSAVFSAKSDSFRWTTGSLAFATSETARRAVITTTANFMLLIFFVDERLLNFKGLLAWRRGLQALEHNPCYSCALKFFYVGWRMWTSMARNQRKNSIV